MRNLADEGAAILFYSTDYDELIGCCDRVLVLYDGAVKRELVGARNHRTGSGRQRPQPRAPTGDAPASRRGRPERTGAPAFWRAQRHASALSLVFVVMFAIYVTNHPAGLHRHCCARPPPIRACCSPSSPWPRPCRADLRHRSLGGHGVRAANCLASISWSGRRRNGFRRCSAVLLVGLLCGVLNGLIIIYGRLQPIVTTIATGASIYGIALALRPVPGGDVNADLADALTGQLPGGIPASLFVLARGRSAHLDAVPALGDWAGGLCGRLLGSWPPTCRACRSAAQNSSPIASRDCSRPWAGFC